MQFHSPSVVQAVPAAMTVPVPVVPVLTGAAEEATEEATGETTALGELAAAELVTEEATGETTALGELAAAELATGAAVIMAVEEVETVTKTPPETAIVEANEAVAMDPVQLGVTMALVTFAVAPARFTRYSPGLGKRTSAFCPVVHPLSTFATNMSGSALKAA